MKLILFAGILFLSIPSFSQEKVNPSNSFSIQGNIKSSATISIHALDTFASKTLGDVTTVNHLGEVKSVRKNVKGILLKDILAKVQMDVSKPKELNSYYFVLTGTDGYRFVLSYSEIFNSDNIYIVTESNGKRGMQIEDRVAVLILTENHRGHIAMKGLSKLLVEKAI